MEIRLKGENISAGGQVDLLKCVNCHHESFELRLSADNDAIYVGIVGLTDESNKRLIITHLTLREYNNYNTELPKGLEKRINGIFNTDSIKFITNKHFLDKATGEKIYAAECMICGSYMKKIGFNTFDDFVENGGEVIAIDTYKKEK